MERKGIFMGIMVLPAILLLLTSCSGEIDLEPHGTSVALIGVKGGTVTGFDGQVVLTIPAGAVSELTSFVISDIQKETESVKADRELLRAFVIEPFVRFKIPAELTVKCHGCLSTENLLTNDMEISFYLWETPTSYYSQFAPCISCCCYDGSLGCINGCISSTGVISTRACGH